MDNLILREIESQLSTDSDLLLRTLASAHSQGATPASARDGKVILENAKRNLREKICTNEKVKTALRGAITGVSPITVSVLLVKEGLDSLCENFWGNEQ